MTKRSAGELNLDSHIDLKKRKLSNNDSDALPMNANNNNNNGNNHNNHKDKTVMDMLCNGRQSFLRSKRKWIQYRQDINHQKLWKRYAQCMENVYAASFPDLRCLKIGNLITFRKNAQFEFMTGVIMRAPNTNPLSIYTESSHQVCIKLLRDSLSTHTINRQLCKINKLKSTHMINTEQDVYSFIPKETFNFEYANANATTNGNGITTTNNGNNNNNNNNNHNLRSSSSLSAVIQQNTTKNHKKRGTKKERRIVKKEMKFETDVVCIDLADYEVFEHREIVWSQLEGFEWHPSQILFKWKNGRRISPSIEKSQFGLLFILVAFFDVHQTARIRLSQRHLLPFYDEPSLDIVGRTRKDVHKYNTLTTQIANAMILATLQQKINNRLHAQYHTDIHIKNALSLKHLCIPKQNWLYQKVSIFHLDLKDAEWKTARVMYFCPRLQLHFIVYDDHCAVQWVDIDADMIYMDWCDDTYTAPRWMVGTGAVENGEKSYEPRDDYYDHYGRRSQEEGEIHTLNGGQTVHNMKEVHGYGAEECSNTKVALSTRFIASDTRNCNKCWVCHEVAMITVAPVCTVTKKSDAMISIHCICCRRRAHIKCLEKAGITRDMLARHALAIHCDECRWCALCKRQLEPQCIVQRIKSIFDINEFMDHHFVKEKEWRKEHMMECNLCRRYFHKKCLPHKQSNNDDECCNNNWLCFDCRICRCCNGTRSVNNEWHEGYTLCGECFAIKDEICAICFKRNHSESQQHEPFCIECHECGGNIHLSCSPFTLDELFVMQCRTEVTYFICHACTEKRMQQIQFNVLRYLINNDNESTGMMIIKHVDSILMLRTHVLCGRVTLLHFVNVFKEIWSESTEDIDAQMVDQMIDFICEVVAKYFNHFYASQLHHVPQSPMKVRCTNDIERYSYECSYLSQHELLILNDICSACGSSHDAQKMIICKRCAVSVHSYCIRSNIDFEKTDNTGYCYACLWYFYQNKVTKMAKHMAMKRKPKEKEREKENIVWMMQASHLKQLFELSQKSNGAALTEDTYREFIVDHDMPLWIKPLLCDVINDTKYVTKYKKRITTKKASAAPSSEQVAPPIPSSSSISALYSTVQYQDGAVLNDNRKCELCDNRTTSTAVCGRLLPVQFDGDDTINTARRRRGECEWIHSKCALSSTDGNIHHYNTYGSNMIYLDMTDILNRASQYKCHICHGVGASMHCAVADCTLSYHYPCIVTCQMYDEDWRYNDRPFFCNMHQMHFNNNHYRFGDDVKITDVMKRDHTQSLYDECLIVLYDRNNIKFISHSRSQLPPLSKAKQLFEIKGNRVIKRVLDNNGDVVIHQVYDTFWSYRNVGKRTQFVYESYRHGPASAPSFLYKLIAMDDPMSSTTFCGGNAKKLFKKLIQQYPQTFEAELLFKAKYAFFL